MRVRNAKRGMAVGFFLLMTAALVGIGLLAGGMISQAKDIQSQDSLYYSIQAELVGSDRDSFSIQITIENNGPDWDGTVRVMPKQSPYQSYMLSAYDTEISLPQGSRKQYTVRVGKDEEMLRYSNQEGSLQVYLLDKKGKKVSERSFDRFLIEDSQYLYMGILSDDFSALTYLDLGGDELYLDGNNYPVKLRDMTQTDLKDGLEELDYLVIDQYNTGVLTAEERDAISDWNYNGGVLMVGTGPYATDVLAGIGDYLGVKCRSIYAVQENAQEDWVIVIAELQDVQKRYSTSYYSSESGLVGSQGDGAIMVLPFALSQLSGQTDLYQYGYGTVESYMRNMILDAYNYASVRYDSNNYSDNMRYLTRIMKFWGNNSNALNFTLLKFIIFLYVIFVGPILYLILKFVKKKELYWVFVPVTTLCAVMLVFLGGRGFKVVNTSVYSVTLENTSGRGMDTSYLYCYDADHREWDLKLAEGYDFVSGVSDNYSYRYDPNDDEGSYYYHMRKTGGANYFGIRPGSSFEDCFFRAQRNSRRDQNSGKIICDSILTSAAASSYFSSGYYGGRIFGQVTNETGEDFVYYAVIADGSAYVYGELRNGETADLGTANPIYADLNGYNLASQFMYDCLDDDDKHWSNKQIGQLSAIGVAIASLYSNQDPDRVIVVGVTDSGDKVVDDKCYEVAYKCLYAVE
ncbi:MAG: hypothetical protein IJ716_17225 [Lachnospiraceae bacterium]|nr:hypothetical protein [Lachnospiraceae bacterium]